MRAMRRRRCRSRAPSPDVITVDLVMPGIDGWNFIEKLRPEDDLATIPIVVVSALPDAKTSGNGRSTSR